MTKTSNDTLNPTPVLLYYLQQPCTERLTVKNQFLFYNIKEAHKYVLCNMYLFIHM